MPLFNPATSGVTDHGALTGLADDDHTQYQQESEKSAPNGYASLDAGTKVPIAELPTGTTASTVCIGNDGRLSDARTPLSHTHGLVDVTDDGALASLNTVGTTQLDNDAVTYAKMQNVSATSRLLGRITAGAGDPEELTGTQATTLLDTFTTSVKGLAPASGGGTTNFLRADGTWTAPTAAAATPLLEAYFTPGSSTIETDHWVYHRTRMTMVSTDRLTAEGTSRCFLEDTGRAGIGLQGEALTPNFVVIGIPKTPILSFIVPTDYQHCVLNRLSLNGTMQAKLQGNADLYLLTDTVRGGRLMLTGNGVRASG